MWLRRTVLVLATVGLAGSSACSAAGSGAPVAEPPKVVFASPSALDPSPLAVIPAEPSPTLAVRSVSPTRAGEPRRRTPPGLRDSRSGTLAFSAPAVGGGTFSGAALTGRPAVLWFWTPSCDLCRGQVADVRGAASRFAGEVTVIGVGGLDSPAALRRFVGDQNAGGFTNLSDVQGSVWQHFGVGAPGTYVLVDGNGEVRFRGPLSGRGLTRRIAALRR